MTQLVYSAELEGVNYNILIDKRSKKIARIMYFTTEMGYRKPNQLRCDHKIKKLTQYAKDKKWAV